MECHSRTNQSTTVKTGLTRCLLVGTNPIDVPNCARCHSNERANGKRYQKYREEHDFWREVRRSSEWYAQLKAAAISILEIHDDP